MSNSVSNNVFNAKTKFSSTENIPQDAGLGYLVAPKAGHASNSLVHETQCILNGVSTVDNTGTTLDCVIPNNVHKITKIKIYTSILNNNSSATAWIIPAFSLVKVEVMIDGNVVQTIDNHKIYAMQFLQESYQDVQTNASLYNVSSSTLQASATTIAQNVTSVFEIPFYCFLNQTRIFLPHVNRHEFKLRLYLNNATNMNKTMDSGDFQISNVAVRLRWEELGHDEYNACVNQYRSGVVYHPFIDLRNQQEMVSLTSGTTYNHRLQSIGSESAGLAVFFRDQNSVGANSSN